jgi:hypothetical protein
MAVRLICYVTVLPCTLNCTFCGARDACMLQGVLDILCYKNVLDVTGCSLYNVSGLATSTSCGKRTLCWDLGKSRLLTKFLFSSFIGFLCLFIQCSYQKHLMSIICGTHNCCTPAVNATNGTAVLSVPLHVAAACFVSIMLYIPADGYSSWAKHVAVNG